MRDVELPCGAREAAQASGRFEGFDRIQRRQARSNHGMSFSHSARQNKSFVIEPSHRQMGLRRVDVLRRWHQVMTSTAPSTAIKPAQSKARVLWIACGAHALHDGFTDALYVLLPLWQAQFALSYAAIGMLAIALVLGGIGSSTQHPIASSLVAAAYEGPRSRGALGTYNFAGDLGKMALPSITAC